jgi:hypothetical protein
MQVERQRLVHGEIVLELHVDPEFGAGLGRGDELDNPRLRRERNNCQARRRWCFLAFGGFVTARDQDRAGRGSHRRGG